METGRPKNPNKALIAIIVVVLLAAAVGAVVIFGSEVSTPSGTTSPTNESSTQSSSSSNESQAASTSYKDGEYTATGTYQTPGGRENVTVKVTLAGGTIEDITTTGSATSGESKQYQGEFLSNYKSQVVGKNIDSVSLSRVAGSSLTSGGFNNALDQIKSDAAV